MCIHYFVPPYLATQSLDSWQRTRLQWWKKVSCNQKDTFGCWMWHVGCCQDNCNIFAWYKHTYFWASIEKVGFLAFTKFICLTYHKFTVEESKQRLKILLYGLLWFDIFSIPIIYVITKSRVHKITSLLWSKKWIINNRSSFHLVYIFMYFVVIASCVFLGHSVAFSFQVHHLNSALWIWLPAATEKLVLCRRCTSSMSFHGDVIPWRSYVTMATDT